MFQSLRSGLTAWSLVIGLSACLFCLPAPSLADEFYISATGNDLPPQGDGSKEHPWRTLEKALEEAVSGRGDTIWLMGDNDSSSTDFICTVVVDKAGVTLKAYSAGGFLRPRVAGLLNSQPVIKIAADHVRLEGFDIVAGAYGVQFVEASWGLISNCRLGVDAGNNNTVGLEIQGGKGATISHSEISHNQWWGVRVLYGARLIAFDDVSINSNPGGLQVDQSQVEVIGSGFDDQGGDHIELKNAYGCSFYLNDFGENGDILLSSIGEPVESWTSPAKIVHHLADGVTMRKDFLGNHYAVYNQVPDGDGNEVADAPYTLSGTSPAQTDQAPLVSSLVPFRSVILYLGGIYPDMLAWSGWAGPGAEKALPAGGSRHWYHMEETNRRVLFPAGDAGDGTSWTGRLTLAANPPEGQELRAEIGICLPPDYTEFIPAGPSAILTLHANQKSYVFSTTASRTFVPPYCLLSFRVTNGGPQTVTLMEGGTWSWISPTPGVEVRMPESASERLLLLP